jgi:hypothetical protein
MILGVVLALAYLPLLAFPDRAQEGLKQFPRARWAAWILTALDLAWVGWLLVNTPLGMFEPYRRAFYAMVPVTFVLVVMFMDELLAPRALGGLLLLAPTPLLDAARWHTSPWRFVVIILAFVLVIKGLTLVLSPFMFRKAVAPLLRRRGLCQAVGLCGVAFGLFVWFLGVRVY